MKWHLRNEHRNSILTACVAGAGYWWHTQIWVVLLIGWSKFFMHHNQSEALPRSGKHHVSVWNFCTWWHHKMLAVYSGGSRRGAHPPPVIFRPNWGPKGRNIFCFRPPPLSRGQGDRALPYLKVRICSYGAQPLVKSFCKTLLKSLFWALTCVPGFEYAPWLACLKCHCLFANQDKRKFKTCFW